MTKDLVLTPPWPGPHATTDKSQNLLVEVLSFIGKWQRSSLILVHFFLTYTLSHFLTPLEIT